MLESIKKIFGMGPAVNYAEMVKNGALIVDVRSKAEFAGGHIKGSTNIPLDQLKGHIPKLKGKTIITCCASGMRSASAKAMLKSSGIDEVHNGGGWSSLQAKIKA